MTFHTTKRLAVIALAASCLVLCMASPSVAQAEGSASEADTASDKSATKEGGGKKGARKKAGGEEKKRLNSVRLSGVYGHHRLRNRDSQTTGEPLTTTEDLGGFEIAYERELIEDHLAIEFAKPFFFSKDSYESPFEATLKGLLVKGPWEGYLGVFVVWNIRIFEQERAEREGQNNILSFGVGVAIGYRWRFTKRWALELGWDYEWVPNDAVVSNSFDLALGGVYTF